MPRVLVMDDDARARDLLARILESAGFEVRGAAGGVAGHPLETAIEDL